MLKPTDQRLKATKLKKKEPAQKDKEIVRAVYAACLPSLPRLTPSFPSPQASSALFFRYNTALGPPYHVLVDTNFINFSIQNKLEIIQAMMDCLLAKCKASPELYRRALFLSLYIYIYIYIYTPC